MEIPEKLLEHAGSGMQAQLELQRRVLEQMAREMPVSHVYYTLLDHLIAVSKCDCAAIQVVEPTAGILRPAADVGLPPPLKDSLGARRCAVSDILGHFKDCDGVLQFSPTPMPVVGESTAFEAFRCASISAGVCDCWAVRAVGAEDSVKAIVLLCFFTERKPEPDEREFLVLVANLLTMAVERERSRRLRESLDRKLCQSQKMEAIGTLAGGIAHDFNNILGGIFGFLHLATEDIGPAHPAQEWLRQIDGACKRARDLVQQVVTFSRTDVSRRVPLNLASVMKDAVKLVRASLPSTVTVEFHRPNDALPDVLGDHTQIQLAVLNICTNAWQSMEHGHGRIDLRLEVIGAGEEFDHVVQLSIEDSGQGIPPEALDRVFDPFFSTRPVGGGTGLGLSVVHGIMSAHEGQVLVNSRPGKGTTFYLQFPAMRSEPPSAVPDPQEIPRGRGERVLFIDDETAIVMWSRLVLERMGYVVEAFTDPEIALQTLEHRLDEFDAVVTDLTMPGISGDEVIRQVRQWKPAMPVVLTSGLGILLSREEYEDLRPAVLLNKPISMEELCDGLRRALAGAGK